MKILKDRELVEHLRQLPNYKIAIWFHSCLYSWERTYRLFKAKYSGKWAERGEWKGDKHRRHLFKSQGFLYKFARQTNSKDLKCSRRKESAPKRNERLSGTTVWSLAPTLLNSKALLSQNETDRTELKRLPWLLEMRRWKVLYKTINMQQKCSRCECILTYVH
jgi:hypothetical protein